MRTLRLPALTIALALAACGGGGGSSPAPSAGAGTTPGNASSTPQSVQVNMHIPGAATTSSTKRSPQFVAASTQGVLVTVYASSDTGHTTPLGSSATNVAPGSTACGGAQGARTCTISIPAPPGTDDFVFVTYDQPPSSGTTFPGNAHLLGTGTVKSQAITIASANVVNVTLGGAIAYLTSNPVVNSFAAGTGAHTYTYEVNAYDGAGDVIIGPYVDVNGNADPVTVTAVEVGGSGYTKVAVGAATPSTTATINSSTDVVTVSYNGLSGNGYYVNLNGAAASGQTVPGTFNPLYISSTSPAFTPGSNATIVLTTAGQSVTINMFEANATTSNVNASNCTNVATVTQPTQGSSTQSFSVTGAAGGSCTIYINFAQANYTINVTAPNSTTANVVVPGNTLAYLAQQSSGVTIDTLGGAQVGTIATTASADGIALDDAGDVFVNTNPNSATSTPGSIAKYVPGGSGYPLAYTRSSNTYTITDPADLNAVFAAGNGLVVAESFNPSNSKLTFDIWSPGAQGSPTRTITRVNAGSNPIPPSYGYLRHDGTLVAPYVVSCAAGTSTCIDYDIIDASSGTISRTFTESRVAAASQPNFYPNYMVLGPDGTLYVAEWEFDADPLAGIYIYPGDGSAERYSGQWMLAPEGLDIDATGNIYAINNNSLYLGPGDFGPDTDHSLNEVSPDGQTLIRSVQIAPNSAPLAVAADGTAVFAQLTNISVGAPGSVFAVTPGQYNPLKISTAQATNIVLYDDTRETTGGRRSALSIGSGTAHGGPTLHIRR